MALSISSHNRAALIASEVQQATGLSEDLSYMVVGSLSPLETGKHEGLQEWQFRMDPSNIRSEALKTIYQAKKIFGSESLAIRETHKEAVQEIEGWLPLLCKELKKHPDARLARLLKEIPIELRQSEIEFLLDKIFEIKDSILVDFFREHRQWIGGQRPVSESEKRRECVDKKMKELAHLPLNEQARELRKWLRDDSLSILQQETMPLLNLYIPPEIIRFQKLDRESVVRLLSESMVENHFDTVIAMIQSEEMEKPCARWLDEILLGGREGFRRESISRWAAHVIPAKSYTEWVMSIFAATRDQAYREVTPRIKALLSSTKSCTERVMSIFVSWFFPSLGNITS